MKAITLWQPWATLMIMGAKTIETRSWATSHRGPLIIHASKRWTDEEEFYFYRAPFNSVLRSYGITEPKDLPFGAALGTVWVLAMTRTEQLRKTIPFEEKAFGNYEPGRWGWVTDVSKLERFDAPVPIKGAQGLWNYDYINADEGTAISLREARSQGRLF